MSQGVQGFIDALTQLGLAPTVEAGLILYRIMPVDGAHAGTEVETGVGTDELGPWPQAPPHWVHLPADIGFPETNSDTSTKTGWLKHSRDIIGWGDAPLGICWTSHVRAVLGEATA